VNLEVEVQPPSPYRLPTYGGEDGVMRIEGGVATRLLHVDGCPVLTRAWEPGKGRVALRAEPIDPDSIAAPGAAADVPTREAGTAEMELALERMRFALGVDDDLSEFYRRFRRDPLLGPQLRRRPQLRPRRRPWPWEALAWAVVKQLIESGRAARIQRRMVGRWGARLGAGRDSLRDVPAADLIAGRAPVELESMGLALKRALALRSVAADVAAGRCELAEPSTDSRLLSVREIGPWTVQCLGLYGRGDPDSLPAGDLIYLKQVGRLARLGRRATVEEVEEFYAPYAPFRGLAAAWLATAA
jgi:3-methyladenine DNA glycosylase/8-oxoguanine DNA glycosylase